MEGYSAREVFSQEEQKLLLAAENIVKLVPNHDIRCHELARVVGILLALPVQDGKYGFVEHSWLWTRPMEHDFVKLRHRPRFAFPNLLDVYCVGSLPQVRLLDCQEMSLPHVGWGYRPGDDRDDIDETLVGNLVASLKIREGSWRPPQ